MINNREIKYFFLIVIVIGLAFFFLNRKEREFILKDYSYTTSKIVKVYRSDGGTTKIKYVFTVNNIPYYNAINPEGNDYNICYDNFDFCDSLTFWVIYSNIDPQKSLIDLTAPLMEGEDPKYTRNLNDFED